MMRYLKYIFLSLISCILTMSCVKELDAPFYGDEVLTTLVPRVKSFTNQYVTKAYSNDEAAINSLSALIFDNDGKFVDIQSGTTSVTINKSMINSPANKEKLTSATIVMFANVSLDNIQDDNGKSIKENLSGLTLENIDGYTCKFAEDKTVITDLSSFKDGFPMVGRATGVNLTSTKAQQNAITVNLKILYAKINFSIKVENGTENTGTGMQFAMTGYSVHNVSKAIELGEPEGATVSSDYSYTSATGKAVNKSGTVALNGTPLTFTFYVAESRYEHNTDLKGIYPSDDWLTADPEQDVKNYDSATDEAKLNGVKYFYDDLIQQYKPKLANVEGGSPGQGLATYVLLKGTYTDYRSTVWTVNYKVYLGKDNSQNFHVDRNSEYTNHITIKGIRNNDSHGNDDVWVDHRVNVSTTDPSGYISITRETLIDAHIEVRPLRVQWEEGKYAGVRVYLPTKDGTLENWIGIERFTGKNCQDAATYCYLNGKSTGKRRYFTTSLISELQTKKGELGVQEDTDGNKFIYLQNGDCAWIYFDEHVSFTNATTPSSARDAVIKLEFFGDDGNKKAEETYNIKQSGLLRKGGFNTESYEEYLHSYDSADKYNLSTSPADYSQQGLSWGLADRTISQTVIASATELGSLVQYVERVPGLENLKYDFYHDSDGNYHRYIKNENGDWVKVATVEEDGKESGWAFTDRATRNTVTTVIDMGSVPENAYQYCLSKNKFEADDEGKVKMVLKWYLPDVHQLKSVLNATENGVSDFKSDDFYWSSQPTYNDDNTIPLGSTPVGLLVEVPSQARAISKAAGVVDTLRTSKNRIRCLYAKSGTEIDMTGRTPDGIGGFSSYVMKGYTDKSKSKPGYFYNKLPSKIDTVITDDYKYTNETYIYPTKDNSYQKDAEFSYFVKKDADNNLIEGFVKNPADQNNWKVGTYYNAAQMLVTAEGYYTTLATYPGLSKYTLDKHSNGNFYAQTSTEKSDIKTVTDQSTINLEMDLPFTLNTLDGSKFNISFNKANGNVTPKFIYDELVKKVETKTEREWIVPTYERAEYEVNTSDIKTITYTATESHTGEKLGKVGNYDLGKMSAFGSISINVFGKTYEFGEGAYAKAKKAAIEGLKKKIKAEFPDYIFDEESASYTELKWDSPEGENLKYTKGSSSWSGTQYTCKCTVTCTLKISPSPVYYKDAINGGWKEKKPKIEESSGINTDELRLYCGNSFTISLSDQVDEEGLKYSEAYEITKVIVHFSGNNLIKTSDSFLGIGEDKYYARLVDSTINLADYSQTIPKYGGAEVTLQLPGMEYVEQSDNSSGTHQWSGEGRSSVTLVLADYVVMDNAAQFSYEYKYQTAKTDLSKYIIVDKIEVKCTKKAQ